VARLIPVIEAGEQTILQRAIPFERQGRVFGFAQLVENAASPLTAFLMAPIAETVFMPLMTDGGERRGSAPGSARADGGIALMFPHLAGWSAWW
jgi:DHA3 family multidrug efflux protein-like MFS transporter